MTNAIRVSMLSALAVIAAFAGQSDVKPAPLTTSISGSERSSANGSARTAQPSGFDPFALSLPPGCRKIVTIDPDCFQQCVEQGEFSRKTCRQACTTETIECDTFPPVR